MTLGGGTSVEVTALASSSDLHLVKLSGASSVRSGCW